MTGADERPMSTGRAPGPVPMSAVVTSWDGHPREPASPAVGPLPHTAAPMTPPFVLCCETGQHEHGVPSCSLPSPVSCSDLGVAPPRRVRRRAKRSRQRGERPYPRHCAGEIPLTTPLRAGGTTTAGRSPGGGRVAGRLRCRRARRLSERWSPTTRASAFAGGEQSRLIHAQHQRSRVIRGPDHAPGIAPTPPPRGARSTARSGFGTGTPFRSCGSTVSRTGSGSRSSSRSTRHEEQVTTCPSRRPCSGPSRAPSTCAARAVRACSHSTRPPETEGVPSRPEWAGEAASRRRSPPGLRPTTRAGRQGTPRTDATLQPGVRAAPPTVSRRSAPLSLGGVYGRRPVSVQPRAYSRPRSAARRGGCTRSAPPSSSGASPT